MRNTRWYPRGEKSQKDTQVTKEEFNANWDAIFGKKDKKVEESEDDKSTDDEKES